MIYGFDDFELDAERLELRQAGRPVKADPLVLRLLAVLMRNADRTVTKEELVDQVWQGRAVADNVVTVSMSRLRKTLRQRRGARELVVTVYGSGYRFVPAVVARDDAREPAPCATGRATDGRLPFVGRERVLDRLRRALSQTHAGRGGMCALTGQPGIGKTRAVEALEDEISGSELRMAWGYCREAGDTPPLWPWRRLLREAVPVSWASELERSLGAAASEVLGLVPELGAAKPTRDAESAAREMIWEGPTRHRGFDAILRTFALAAEHKPWVLVLEDLHCADAASLELLSHLLGEIAHMRILVIATLRQGQGRPAPRPETHLPQVLGHRNCERIALEPLREEDVEKYVAALLDDPDGSLGRAVFAKSEGNPFFMIEVARQLASAEHPSPEVTAVPDTALELIRQRVARLDDNTRQVLSRAAVIGRSFELPLLQGVTGLEPSALMASLDDALDAEVVVAAPDSMTAFAFGHELLRVALYDALSPAEQRRWHLRVAQALELRADAGDAVPPTDLAYHYHAALPESDLRKTVHFCRAAAAAAAEVFANIDVVRYARHAIEALELMEKPSLRLRMGLLFVASVYARGTVAAESTQSIRELLRLAREHGDGPMLVRVALMLNPIPGLKPLAGASAALERALQLLPADDAGMRSMALGALACAAPQCYRKKRTQVLISESVALARKVGNQDILHGVLLCKRYMQGGPAHVQEVAEVVDELERLAQQNLSSMPVLPLHLAFCRAVAALQRGDATATMAAIERALARCRELLQDELLWHCERFRALANINAGAWSDGLAALDALHRQAQQASIWGAEPLCTFDRVVIFSERDQAPAVDDALLRSLQFDPSEPPSIWSLKLRALATAGLMDEARAALRAVPWQELARLPCDYCYLGTLAHVARAALLLEALDYAEALYALLAPYGEYFTGHVSFLCEGSVPQLLGMLAHALGRHAPAVDHLEAGLRMNERAAFAPRAAEARVQLARCLLDETCAESRQRALALAREAHSEGVQMGMQRLARDASALLQLPETA